MVERFMQHAGDYPSPKRPGDMRLDGESDFVGKPGLEFDDPGAPDPGDHQDAQPDEQSPAQAGHGVLVTAEKRQGAGELVEA